MNTEKRIALLERDEDKESRTTITAPDVVLVSVWDGSAKRDLAYTTTSSGRTRQSIIFEKASRTDTV